MKRLIPMFLFLCLLFSIAACAPATEQEGGSSHPTDHAPNENDAIEDQMPITISLDPVSEVDYAHDGTAIFAFRYQDVQVTVAEYSEAAQAILNALNATIGDARERAQSDRQWAKESYDGTASWTPHYVELNYTPSRADSCVVSFYAHSIEFSGGSHPNWVVLSATYDTTTGSELTISDLLAEPEQIKALEALVLAHLKERSEPYQLFADFEDVVKERFDLALASSTNWYLSPQGIVYHFAPYEIAPYVSGVIEVEIPYGELSGILDEQYIPMEDEFNNTDLQAGILSDISDDFSQVYTVITDAEGERIGLYGFTAPTQIEISAGYWGIDDNQFYVTQTLFLGTGLTKDDCVEIRTYIPDTLPNIRITVGGDKGKTVYLSQSGEDGSILLLEEGFV